MSKNKSINYNLIRGALWSVMMRWSMKAIGLVNTVILARLLTPDDFGVVAMASLVVGVLYSFSELGVQTYLIREKDVDTELTNTAWTLKIIQYCVLSCFLVLSAPYVAIYFNEPRVTSIIYFLALASFIGGFGNIGVVFLLKDLNFKKDFKFNVIKRILVFIVTISAAFELKNYWALVIGQVTGTFLGVIMSYFVHDYRPSFLLSRYREFIKFSFSIIPMNIGQFINNKIDVLIVGRIADTSILGGYNMASDLSSLFTRELIFPISRGLFPNFAKLRNDTNELAIAYINCFRYIVFISLPVGFGLNAVANDFIYVVLGSQWIKILPFVKWLAIYATLESLIQLMNGRILVVTGKEASAAIFLWIRVLTISSCSIISVLMWGINAIAPALVLSVLILFPLSMFILSRAIKIKFIEIFSILLVPLLASLIMLTSIEHIPAYVDIPIVRLMSKITLGCCIYFIVVFLIWIIKGRPDGVEKYLVNYIKKRF